MEYLLTSVIAATPGRACRLFRGRRIRNVRRIRTLAASEKYEKIENNTIRKSSQFHLSEK